MTRHAPADCGAWVLARACDDIDDEDVIRFDRSCGTQAVHRVNNSLHARPLHA